MPAVAALLLDVVLTTAFAVIGRASHAEGLTLGGIFGTAWPFLAGLAAGWIAAAAPAKSAPLSVRAGWPIWILTVAIGLLLRGLTGAGTAPAFIVVAALTLGVLLLGWRLLRDLLARDRRSPHRR